VNNCKKRKFHDNVMLSYSSAEEVCVTIIRPPSLNADGSMFEEWEEVSGGKFFIT
jgi:hypothetical protein